MVSDLVILTISWDLEPLRIEAVLLHSFFGAEGRMARLQRLRSVRCLCEATTDYNQGMWLQDGLVLGEVLRQLD